MGKRKIDFIFSKNLDSTIPLKRMQIYVSEQNKLSNRIRSVYKRLEKYPIEIGYAVSEKQEHNCKKARFFTFRISSGTKNKTTHPK